MDVKRTVLALEKNGSVGGEVLLPLMLVFIIAIKMETI